MLSRSGNQAPTTSARRRGEWRNRPQHRGFTLGEMTVATAVAGVLVLGMSSAVMFSLQAGEAAEGTKDTGTETANVLDQITRDLGDALAFNERSSVSAAFTVPDRDGDGDPEMLRYAWSGVAGDPLTFRYNGSPAVKLAANVHHFNLNYLLRTIGPANGACCLPDGGCMEDSQANCEATAGALYHGDDTLCEAVECLQESQEMILIAHDDAPGGGMYGRSVTANSWVGSYFAPVLPANVVSWKVTRIQLRAKTMGGSSGVVAVQIMTADNKLMPTGTVLDETTLVEASLPGGITWVDVPYGPLADLDPTRALCVVVAPVSGGGMLMWFEYESSDNPMTANAHIVRTSDAGGSWSIEKNQDLRFIVYGTVTTTGPPEWP